MGITPGNKRGDGSFDPCDIAGKAAMVVFGAGIMATGAKMLIESGKNKKMAVLQSFKNEIIPQIKNSGPV